MTSKRTGYNSSKTVSEVYGLIYLIVPPKRYGVVSVGAADINGTNRTVMVPLSPAEMLWLVVSTPSCFMMDMSNLSEQSCPSVSDTENSVFRLCRAMESWLLLIVSVPVNASRVMAMSCPSCKETLAHCDCFPLADNMDSIVAEYSSYTDSNPRILAVSSKDAMLAAMEFSG